MGDALSVKPQVVVVLGHEYPTIHECGCNLLPIHSSEQAGLLRRGDIDVTLPKFTSDDGIHVFVEVKANRPRHLEPYLALVQWVEARL